MKVTVQDIKDHLPALTLAAVILLAGLLGPRLMSGFGPSAPGAGDEKGFYRDCVTRVLAGGDVLPSCANSAAMAAAYKVDAGLMLATAQGRMAETVRRIVNGNVYDEKTYNQCLKNGTCVPVPVVPRGGDQDSAAGRAARAEFWHLARDGGLTAGTCQMLDICRALLKIGLIDQPPPVETPAP